MTIFIAAGFAALLVVPADRTGARVEAGGPVG